MNTTILYAILMATLISVDSEMGAPKPYPLGFGDTLMVRTSGKEFCPKHCDIDHFHNGHFKNYNCEYVPCEHITVNDDE